MPSETITSGCSSDEVTAFSCGVLADVTDRSVSSKVVTEGDEGDDEIIFPSKQKKKKTFAVYDSDDDEEKPSSRAQTPLSEPAGNVAEILSEEVSSKFE